MDSGRASSEEHRDFARHVITMERGLLVIPGDPGRETGRHRAQHGSESQHGSEQSGDFQQGFLVKNGNRRPYNTDMNAPLLQASFDEADALPFARAVSADLLMDDCGPQLYPPVSGEVTETSFVRGAIAPIADLALLKVHGADAVAFLQGQLTNDVAGLAENSSMLAGYCSAKGRMLASMRVWREGEEVRLMPSRVLAAGLVRRLSMFVLRAKVKLEDASARHACLGLSGDQAIAMASAMGARWPDPGEVSRFESLRLIGLEPFLASGASVPRALLLCAIDEVPALWVELTARLEPVSSVAWRWTEVRSGIGRIVGAAVERFVPQMLNFDLVNGVSFRKGCYPGQEIVARSHYLGKLKRRMYLSDLPGEPPPAGTDVLDARTGEPCGQIILSARDPGDGAAVLFESQIASADSVQLADGRRLTVQPLPYPVPQA